VFSWLCLFSGLFAATLSINALVPLRGRLSAPSFMAALVIAELGFLQALLCGGFGFVFYESGAAATLPGRVGLVLYGLGFLGALALELRASSAAALSTATLKELGELTFPPRLSWRARPLAFSHRGVECTSNLSYGPAGRRNQLDIYRPRGASLGGDVAAGRLRPVLLQIHGGAWVLGTKQAQARPLLLHMASAGWVCVAINYRLSPRNPWPAHLDDCKLALRWIREHIAEYGGDPDRVVVSGGSAGGHLTACLGLSDPGLAGCVPFYGPYDLGALFSAGKGRLLVERVCRAAFRCEVDDQQTLTAASPLTWVHAGAPPFLVIHGTADNVAPVDQARRFVAALKEVSKQPVHYIELPGAIHAFDLFRGARTAATVAAVHRFAEWAVARPAPAKLPVPQKSDGAALG
jgi:acetyl esterase/lipase